MIGIIIGFSVLAVLLASSALISGSESAFFSLKPSDKEILEDSGDKPSNSVLALMKKPQDLLATILVTNNFVNVGIVILSSYLLKAVYPTENANPIVYFLVEVVAITLVLLLFGEVIPKIYATKNAVSFSRLMARPLSVLSKIPPISWLQKGLTLGSRLIQKAIGRGAVKITTGELEQAVALTKEEDDENNKILEGIVRFGTTEVRQIMTARLDVSSIDVNSDFEEVMKSVLEFGHSRLPVYENDFDSIKGVLFIKDLLPYLGSDKDFNWVKLIRKPFFVPENKKIDDLLKEFQEKKFHIAMVVDEYGGTSGIVTLEDILEEIVGDITDEFDDDEIVYTKIDDNTYLFEGKTALVDFVKAMGIEDEELELDSKMAETLGGYITEKAGRILMNNEYIVTSKVKFIVESSDRKRIKMVKAVKL